MKRRVLEKLKITEISAVDRPCQEHATVAIMKRDESFDFSDIAKKLGAKATASDYIHDFVNSDDPRFKGKSKEERIQMALGAFYGKRDFSTEQRKKAVKAGAAMAGGRFPIYSAKDVSNAVRDWGRSGSSPAVKAHIISRARAVGATDSLPDGWITKGDLADRVATLKKQIDDLNKPINKFWSVLARAAAAAARQRLGRRGLQVVGRKVGHVVADASHHLARDIVIHGAVAGSAAAVERARAARAAAKEKAKGA